MTLRLPTSKTRAGRAQELSEFAHELEKISDGVGFRMSARGWAYALEGMRLINKDQFDLVETLINTCRELGYLNIDFTAEEEGRRFSGVEIPTTNTIPEFQRRYLTAVGECEEYFTPEWWNGEKYYIQMLVEKIDLKSLFRPVCAMYHIPVATSKGWSSMLQRAEYARRFKEAEENGLECVLLYCGDHDPDGLRISKSIYDNLDQLKNITWADGTTGYDPSNLIIDRFGLNYDLIEELNLTWIDNLITGSGKNLASPYHKNFHLEYVQTYLEKVGERKCEANAIVKEPDIGRALCNAAIEKYLGKDSRARFQAKSAAIKSEFRSLRSALTIQLDDPNIASGDCISLEDAINAFSNRLEQLIDSEAEEPEENEPEDET